jgi:hypothetical protein
VSKFAALLFGGMVMGQLLGVSRATQLSLWALLAGLTLSSCMTEAERVAQNAQDDRQCLSYGAKKGSDAYVACRSQLASAHTTAEAIVDSTAIAPAPIIAPAPAPMRVCTGLVCY